MTDQDFMKYRWFFTSSGKLVIGGKNAEQNERLVNEIIKSKNKENYIVMHTSQPGSPFTFLYDIGVNEKDLEEQAIFTACFSQEWKKARKNSEIGIFNSSQILKRRGMKIGTFGILGRVIKRRVELKLYLTIQENKLRSVPKTKVKDRLAIISPGKMDKDMASKKIMALLNKKDLKISIPEIQQAIPSGKINITTK